MYIYRVIVDYQGYDTNDGHVIVAHNKAEAVSMAANAARDKGSTVWLIKESDTIRLGKADKVFKFPEILLTSFNAG